MIHKFYLKGPKWFVLLIFTCLPLCSIQLIRLQAARASVISKNQQQSSASDRVQQDTANATIQSKSESELESKPVSVSVSQPLADIVIGSVEEEQFGSKLMDKNGAHYGPSDVSGAVSGDRHRYDQQTLDQPVSSESADTNQQQQQQRHDSNIESTLPQVQKIEARNEQDSTTGNSNAADQSQQADQIIIDHRPIAPESDQQQLAYGYSGTQTPPASTTPSYNMAVQPSMAASATSVPTTIAPSGSSTSGSVDITQQQQQQQQQQFGASSLMINGQVYPQWTLTSNQPQQQMNGVFYTRPISNANSNQQQQQFGSMMSGSNQIVSVQHPNSMIGEQQAVSAQTMSQPSNAGQALTSGGQQQQPQQQGPLILVGSPQSPGGVALMPSGSAMSQQQVQFAMGPNGRKASLSNWLKGLGSMLANIFNRRENGGLGNNLPQTIQLATSTASTSASSPSSHWIQLGASAPHWLTQAQSALQLFQQKHHQLTLAPGGTNRFATFIQTTPQQQQQQISQTSQLIAGQQQVALGGPMAAPGQQQQLIQQSGSNNYQQVGDLQASGSSNSYVTIQTPSGSMLSTNQPYQPNGPITLVVGQQPLQQQQQQLMAMPAQSGTGLKSSGGGGGDQSSPAATAGSSGGKQVAPQANQQAQAATPASGLGTGGNQSSRFGRSSKKQAGGGPVQPLAAATVGGQQQHSTTITTQSSGNLPLAHYSQYASNAA